MVALVTPEDRARKLRAARGARKWSQGELARRAGVSRRTIVDLEHGRRNEVHAHTLAALASALGKPTEWLLCLVGCATMVQVCYCDLRAIVEAIPA